MCVSIVSTGVKSENISLKILRYFPSVDFYIVVSLVLWYQLTRGSHHMFKLKIFFGANIGAPVIILDPLIPKLCFFLLS